MAVSSEHKEETILKLEKTITQITTATLQQHKNWLALGRWRGAFNFSVWLKIPAKTPEGTIQLILQYSDKRGEKSVIVDNCLLIGAQVILLNGTGSLDVYGVAKNVKLIIKSTNPVNNIDLMEYSITPAHSKFT